MSETAKRKGTNMSIIITILVVAFIGRTNTFVSPVLGVIAKNFPNVSMSNIQLVMTMGMIGAFPMTIITGALSDKFRPKALVIAGCILISVGSLFPVIWHNSIGSLYLSNFIMGVGQGLALTVSSILIAQLFEEPTRARMFGLRASFQQIGYMIMAFVAGILASMMWYKAYLTGIFTVVALILVIIFLPNVEKAEKTMQEANVEKRKGIPAETWIVSIFILIFGIPFATSIINSAMLLDSQLHLGPAVAGSTSMITGVVSIVGGLVYKNIAKYLKQHILWVGSLLVMIGLFLHYSAASYPQFLIGSCFNTLGFLFAFTGGLHAFPKLVAPNQVSFGIGFYMALQSLASMVCPYVINPIGAMLTGGKQTAKGNYLVSVVWMAVAVVIGIIWAFAHKKQYQENELPTKANN